MVVFYTMSNTVFPASRNQSGYNSLCLFSALHSLSTSLKMKNSTKTKISDLSYSLNSADSNINNNMVLWFVLRTMLNFNGSFLDEFYLNKLFDNGWIKCAVMYKDAEFNPLKVVSASCFAAIILWRQDINIIRAGVFKVCYVYNTHPYTGRVL